MISYDSNDCAGGTGLNTVTSFVVKVLTGAAAAASQNGATAVSNSVVIQSLALTPNASSSRIYGSMYITALAAQNPSTPLASTTIFYDQTNNPNGGREWIDMRGSNVTTSGVAQTIGIDNTSRSAFVTNIALAEIKASGTIAEDGSAPAAVGGPSTSGTSFTTASFNPPAGSLLVVIAHYGAGTFTVSDSQSLTWSKLVSTTETTGTDNGIWIAQVPAGGTNATATPGVVSALVSIPTPTVIVPAPPVTYGHSSVGTGRSPDLFVSGKLVADATVGEG